MQLLKYLIYLPMTGRWLVQALDTRLAGNALAFKFKPPSPDEVNSMCKEFFKSDPDPATVWKSEFAATELQRFEKAWARDARFCEACRGLSKKECDERLTDTPDLRSACRRGIREAAKGRWAVGAYRWFMGLYEHGETCEVEEDCFPLPECRETQGPASFIVLKSIHHL